ncbi:hypothetical protein Q3G72_018887 [Acer saccharum]|nr:hypothetical protein Q3G72_018887 [Acer saccharum]
MGHGWGVVDLISSLVQDDQVPEAVAVVSRKSDERDCVSSAFPRDERILDNLVDKVQECVSDEYNTLEGIIIATKLYPVGPPVNIHTLMEDLCKKGKFESLKYTCWKDNTASRRTDVECNLDFDMLDDASRSLGGRGGGDLLDMISAKRMLQTSLDVLNTLVERER